jgi:hypothetical protein
VTVKSGVHVCDFCSKSDAQVKTMIYSLGKEMEGGYDICDECLVVCLEILREREDTELDARIDAALKVTSPVFEQQPDVELVDRHCFYVGPFREPFDTIYGSRVKPAVTALGCSIIRADEIFGTGVVIDDVWNGIVASSLVIAELTGKNPNVMYEVGMAHTIGRPVLMLSQYAEDIPFDLRHRRAIIYDNTPSGLATLATKLSKTVRAVLKIEDRPTQPGRLRTPRDRGR